MTSVHVNIPSYLKRTLTTMQIAQFYMGAILTSLYLFARYDISVIDMHEMPSLDVAQINNTFIRRAPVYNLRFEVSTPLHPLAETHVLTKCSYPLSSPRAGASLAVAVHLTKSVVRSATALKAPTTIFYIPFTVQEPAASVLLARPCTSWQG